MSEKVGNLLTSRWFIPKIIATRIGKWTAPPLFGFLRPLLYRKITARNRASSRAWHPVSMDWGKSVIEAGLIVKAKLIELPYSLEAGPRLISLELPKDNERGFNLLSRASDEGFAVELAELGEYSQVSAVQGIGILDCNNSGYFGCTL